MVTDSDWVLTSGRLWEKIFSAVVLVGITTLKWSAQLKQCLGQIVPFPIYKYTCIWGLISKHSRLFSLSVFQHVMEKQSPTPTQSSFLFALVSSSLMIPPLCSTIKDKYDEMEGC